MTPGPMVSLDLASSLVDCVLDGTDRGARSSFVGWTEASSPSEASISLFSTAPSSCSPVKIIFLMQTIQ